MSWNLGNEIWAIDPDSVNQAGCIRYTSQGLEFDYVGVILRTGYVFTMMAKL